MGNDVSTSRRWLYENILFLDPDEEEDDVVQGTKGGEGNTLDPLCGRRGVRRFTPATAKLRGRQFRIFFVLQGIRREFVLRLINNPHCLLEICTKSGELLRSIPTSRVFYMERSTQTAIQAVFDTSVKRSRARPRDNARKGQTKAIHREELSSLSFEFDDGRDCGSFLDAVQAMFGIPVKSFAMHGYSDSEDEQEQGDQMQHNKTDRPSCPIHGDEPCRCVIQKLAPPRLPDSVEDAEYSDQFPIAIEGRCQSGSDLQYKDLSVMGRRSPGRVIQWFVALHPGRDPTYPSKPLKVGPLFQPTDNMVGSYIKVRVSRHLDESLEESMTSPLVYSEAVKGPLTVDDLTAKGVLETIVQAAVALQSSTDTAGSMVLLQLSKEQVGAGLSNSAASRPKLGAFAGVV